MNPPPVLTQFANPDPNAAPLNVTQLVQLLNALVSSAIQGSYIPYVISADTPGADDHDKAWIKLSSTGIPLGTFIWYNGAWRRIYNGMIGEIRGYSGNPATDFDTDGLGNIGGNYDGWHLCNGKNGVIDLSDKFIIGGHMSDLTIGYSAGWQTNVEGSTKKTGGNAAVTLDAAHTYMPDIPAVRARLWSATGNAPQPHTGDLWGVKSSTDSENDNIAPAITGNTSPTAVDIVNPYLALAWITFVGY